MRSRRGMASGEGWPEEEEAAEDPPTTRRRPGKAPVEEADTDGNIEMAADEEEGFGRTGRLVGRRRAAAGDDGAGPSRKQARLGSAALEQESGGASARQQAAAVAAAGGDSAALQVTNADLRAVDDKVAQYRRVKDHAFEKADGKAPRPAMESASRAVVRYMLFAHAEKPGVPVKRTELASVVTAKFPNLKSKAPVIAYAIAHAQHYLAESLGLEMRAMAKHSARGPEAEEGSQQYMLRSIVPPQLQAAFVLEPSQDAERGLLMVVLALINLAGGKLEEEELFTQLGELGICKEQPHPVFGVPPALLKIFCTRRYIQQDKQQGPDGEVFTYRFAEQAVGADAEIGEAAINRFIEEQFAAP